MCGAASFATSSSHMSLQPMAVVMVGGNTMTLPQLPPASQLCISCKITTTTNTINDNDDACLLADDEL